MVEPIRPEEIKVQKVEFHDFVIEAFNELIQEKWNEAKKCAVVKQEEIVIKILEKSVSDKNNAEVIERNEIFKNHWLDVEDTYRAYGWDVKYFKKPYYETNKDSYFVFTKNEETD